MPPAKAYTNLGYVLENDKAHQVYQMVEENKQIRANGGFALNELDWPDAPNFDDLMSGPLHSGPISILVDGVPRQIAVDSDVATQLSPLNDLSWGLGYMDDNKIFNPIINPFGNFGPYRFVPNKQLYQDAESNPSVRTKILEYETNKVRKEMSDYDKEQLDIALNKQARSKFTEKDYRAERAKREHRFDE